MANRQAQSVDSIDSTRTSVAGRFGRAAAAFGGCRTAKIAAMLLLAAGTAMFPSGVLARAMQPSPSVGLDANDDGVTDTVESVTSPAPAVRILSGVDGSVLRTLAGQTGEAFGSATRTFVDVTGDSHPELLVYADAGATPNAGAVYLFDVRTGVQVWRLGIADTTPAWLGVTGPVLVDLHADFSVIPDQTEDGVPDVILSGRVDPQSGYTGDVVIVVSGRSGTRLALREMTYATALAVVGGNSPARLYRPTDIDGSGIVDTNDLLLYINATVNGLPGVDLNGDGVLNSADTLLMIRDLTDRAAVVISSSSLTSASSGSGGGQSSTATGSGSGSGTGTSGSYTGGYSVLTLRPDGVVLSDGSPAGRTFGDAPLPSRDACDVRLMAPDRTLPAPGQPYSILTDGLPHFEPIRQGPLQRGEDYWFRIRPEQAEILRNGGTWPGGPAQPGEPLSIPEGEVRGWTFGAHFYGTTDSQNANTQSPVRSIPIGEWDIVDNPASPEYLTSGRLRRPTWMNHPQSGGQNPGIVRVQLTVVVQPPASENNPLPSEVTICYIYDYVIYPECTGLQVDRLNTFGRSNVCPEVFTPGQAIVVRALTFGSASQVSPASQIEWNVTYASLSGVASETARTSGSGVLRLNPPPDTGLIEVWVRNRGNSLCDPNPSQKFTLTASVDNDDDCVPDACEMNSAQPAGSTRFCTNPGKADTDNDTFLDGVELALGSDPCNPSSRPNSLGDSDGDGLTDFDEVTVHYTNPNLIDTDGDGASDFAEVELRRWQLIGEDALVHAPALRGVALFNALDPRSVNGVTFDGFTAAYRAFDNDGDRLFDPWEEMVGLNPSSRDEDGDGINDGLEIAWGWNPLRSSSSPSAGDTAASDWDGDGLSDEFEAVLGTNPRVEDSDGDGMSDSFELSIGSDPVTRSTADGFAGNANADDDGDGLSNSDESLWGTDPLNPDSDGDGVTDGVEASHNGLPNSPRDFGLPPLPALLETYWVDAEATAWGTADFVGNVIIGKTRVPIWVKQGRPESARPQATRVVLRKDTPYRIRSDADQFARWGSIGVSHQEPPMPRSGIASGGFVGARQASRGSDLWVLDPDAKISSNLWVFYSDTWNAKRDAYLWPMPEISGPRYLGTNAPFFFACNGQTGGRIVGMGITAASEAYIASSETGPDYFALGSFMRGKTGWHGLPRQRAIGAPLAGPAPEYPPVFPTYTDGDGITVFAYQVGPYGLPPQPFPDNLNYLVPSKLFVSYVLKYTKIKLQQTSYIPRDVLGAAPGFISPLDPTVSLGPLTPGFSAGEYYFGADGYVNHPLDPAFVYNQQSYRARFGVKLSASDYSNIPNNKFFFFPPNAPEITDPPFGETKVYVREQVFRTGSEEVSPWAIFPEEINTPVDQATLAKTPTNHTIAMRHVPDAGNKFQVFFGLRGENPRSLTPQKFPGVWGSVVQMNPLAAQQVDLITDIDSSIKWEITQTIDPVTGSERTSWSVVGRHDQFPAHQLFILPEAVALPPSPAWGVDFENAQFGRVHVFEPRTTIRSGLVGLGTTMLPNEWDVPSSYTDPITVAVRMIVARLNASGAGQKDVYRIGQFKSAPGVDERPN